MSEKEKRTHFPPAQMKDAGGNSISFHPTESEITEIDISNGYVPKSIYAQKSGFWICPLVSGTITVRLVGQVDTNRSLPIPVERIDANIGQYLEEKCVEILATGTTVTRALIVWSE